MKKAISFEEESLTGVRNEKSVWKKTKKKKKIEKANVNQIFRTA